MAGRKTMRHSEDWWELIAPPTAVRCSGHTQDGNRCRREAISGGTACFQHGGAAGHVRAAAAARIGNAANEMVKRLMEMLDDPATPPAVRAKVMQDMLDRAGLNMVEKHVVAVDSVETLFRDLLADPANFTDTSVVQVSVAEPDPVQLALDRAQEGPDWEDIVEAEVVDDPEPERTDLEYMAQVAKTQYTRRTIPAHIYAALEELL